MESFLCKVLRQCDIETQADRQKDAADAHREQPCGQQVAVLASRRDAQGVLGVGRLRGWEAYKQITQSGCCDRHPRGGWKAG